MANDNYKDPELHDSAGRYDDPPTDYPEENYDAADSGHGYDDPEATPEEKRPSAFSRFIRGSADSIVGDALHGRILSTDFFRRHWLAVFGVVAMLMIYITNRYTCQTQMETIQRLQKELEVAKTERVREKSSYMSRIRESRMQARVDSLRLGLTVQEQPPFRITSD